MSSFAFDLESVPLQSSLLLEYPAEDRNPPGSYKNEDAIARWREADLEKWEGDRIKAYSLNPRLGRVVAIGYGSDDPTIAGADLAKTEGDEAGLLRRFWELVEAAGDRTYTWNGHGFDVPYLIVRSLLNGVRLPALARDMTKRYATYPHCDVKMVLLNWPSGGYVKGEGLSEWAQAFGLEPKSGHGSQVYQQVRDGQWAELSAYATDDAVLTWNLAKKIQPLIGG